MDIMRPPLKQQVSPAPWLVARARVDLPTLIRKVLAQQPDSSVDHIVRRLSDWGIQASGIIVSMWILKLREQTALADTVHGPSTVAA